LTGVIQSYAARQRREGQRHEFAEQIKLVRMMGAYLDRRRTWWTALENKPRSALSGALQLKRGCKSGLADVLVISARHRHAKPIFIELKSRGGLASKVQKQVRSELLPAGAGWFMARSANAAMMALYRSGVAFRRPWQPPPLEAWEGPFADPNRRLPQAPDVAERKRAYRRRYRERQRAARRAPSDMAAPSRS